MEDSEIRFELQAEEHEDTLVINVIGRIDGMNTKEFHSALQQTGQGHDGRAIILDLGDLSYISSAGLRSILLVAESMYRREIKLALCSPPGATLETIQTTGFDNIVDVYVSRSSAMDAVAQ